MGACAAPEYREIDIEKDHLPTKAILDEVPFYPQKERWPWP